MWARRAFAILATLAALLAAPPATSAVRPNVLTSPTASPSAGTTQTTFTFSVHYRSAAGTPATSVSVDVADRRLAMRPTGGTPIDGTWAASATLPPGTWTTTFSASTDRAPQPRVTGPTVVVSALASPTAAGGSAAAAESTAGSPPAAAPSETAAPSSSSAAAPSSASTPTGAADSTGAGSTSAADPGAATETTSGDGPGGGLGTGPAAPDAAPAVAGSPIGASGPAPGSPGGSPAGDRTRLSAGDDLVWTVIGVGLAGVALVALGGSIWVLAGRRRTRDEEPLLAAGAAEAAEAAEASDLGAAAADRRAMRRARIRPVDDPILAALGLGDEGPAEEGVRPAPPRVRHVRQVSSGPGERETHRARRPRGG